MTTDNKSRAHRAAPDTDDPALPDAPLAGGSSTGRTSTDGTPADATTADRVSTAQPPPLPPDAFDDDPGLGDLATGDALGALGGLDALPPLGSTPLRSRPAGPLSTGAAEPPPLPEDASSELDPPSLPELPDLDSGALPDTTEVAALGAMPMPEPRELPPEPEEEPIDEVPAPLKRRVQLGEILLRAGVIQEDQLEMALAEQRRTRNLLGEVLVSLGFTTDLVVAQTVARQTGIPFVHVPKDPINAQLLKLLPEEVCRRHRLIPLGIEGTVLRLAMANPFDVVALDTLRETTGLLPDPAIAPWNEILASIERSFSQRESFDESFESLIAAAEARADDDKEAVTRGPVVELVDQLILHGVEERATDIHIEPEEHVVRVRYRVDSILQPGPMIPKKLQQAIVARLKIMASLNISENRLPQDGRIRFEIKGRPVDLRISTFLCNFGENVVLRVLDKASVVLSLDKLGFFEDDRAKLEKFIAKPHGIILVTGPTGSGKTTTLYAALSKLNTVDVNIMTIEDPIEYELSLIRQSQVNTKAGITFASGLRALLRQDPDIILIGEMRDQETAQMAVRASMTGHLVFSTLHTNTAIGAIPRLVDMGIEPLLVVDTIIGVLAQRLCRIPCTKCKTPVPCPPHRRQELEEAAIREQYDWNGMVMEARGCAACRFRGYSGRVALLEVFEMTAQAQSLILQKRYGSDLQAYAREHGMRTMYEDGLRRVLHGILTLDELDRVIDREVGEELI